MEVCFGGFEAWHFGGEVSSFLAVCGCVYSGNDVRNGSGRCVLLERVGNILVLL